MSIRFSNIEKVSAQNLSRTSSGASKGELDNGLDITASPSPRISIAGSITKPLRSPTKKDVKISRNRNSTGQWDDSQLKKRFADPRWKMDPRRYYHLREKTYPYISKITHELKQDPEWTEKVEEFQKNLNKRNASWEGLIMHLYPTATFVPAPANNLRDIHRVLLDHGASSSGDPSLIGCIIRVLQKSSQDQTFAESVVQDLQSIVQSEYNAVSAATSPRSEVAADSDEEKAEEKVAISDSSLSRSASLEDKQLPTIHSQASTSSLGIQPEPTFSYELENTAMSDVHLSNPVENVLPVPRPTVSTDNMLWINGPPHAIITFKDTMNSTAQFFDYGGLFTVDEQFQYQSFEEWLLNKFPLFTFQSHVLYGYDVHGSLEPTPMGSFAEFRQRYAGYQLPWGVSPNLAFTLVEKDKLMDFCLSAQMYPF